MELKDKIRLFNGVGSWKTYTAGGTIPEIVMSDGPHGLRKQEAENYADLNKSNIATCFPTASCIAASWDKEALKLLGKTIAKEALKEKVHIMLGCGMNIKRSPLCGRNFEYFSEDPYLSGKLAANYVKGMQQEGVGACIKHFACNNQEKRRQTSSSNVDKKTLHEIYLRGFEIAVKEAKPVSIMCSYNKVNELFTCHSDYLLNRVLRQKWGFDGIVISDWGACIDAAKCVKAGMDLAMPDSSGYFDLQLEQAIAEGRITEQNLDVVNQRVINTANKLKEMRNKALSDKENQQIDVSYDEHYEIALQLAENSAVLLQNKGILPLNSEINSDILVIGELAEFMKFQAGGSSHITTREHPNALQALEKLGFKVDYEKGYYSDFCKRSKAEKKNRPYIQKAVEKAKKAAAENKPILLFCGLTESFEGEGFDRSDLLLPQEQLQLIKEVLEITTKVVIVSFSGAPIDLSSAKNAEGILHMYLCGEACGDAVAALISGSVNPSGKVAETWPLKIEDTPCHNNFSLEKDSIEYKEGELVGYRWYEAKNLPVQYPFGFGLSYTTFDYKDLIVENCADFDSSEIKKVQLKVKNTGKVAGRETVQIYIQKEGSAYKELRGFEKVSLNPEEEKTVEIELDSNAFKVFDEVKNEFVTKEGNYTIYAAGSINDLKLEKEIQIKENPCKATFNEAEKLQEELECKDFFNKTSVENKTGKRIYTITDSLGDMATASFRIRALVRFLTFAVVLMNKGKSREDPSVKIVMAALLENPLESLISTSGGIISYKFAKKLVKWAN